MHTHAVKYDCNQAYVKRWPCPTVERYLRAVLVEDSDETEDLSYVLAPRTEHKPSPKTCHVNDQVRVPLTSDSASLLFPLHRPLERCWCVAFTLLWLVLMGPFGCYALSYGKLDMLVYGKDTQVGAQTCYRARTTANIVKRRDCFKTTKGVRNVCKA